MGTVFKALHQRYGIYTPNDVIFRDPCAEHTEASECTPIQTAKILVGWF